MVHRKQPDHFFLFNDILLFLNTDKQALFFAKLHNYYDASVASHPCAFCSLLRIKKIFEPVL